MREAPISVRRTKMCPTFYTGLCNDVSCNFAHSFEELRIRSPSETDSHPYSSPLLSPATPEEPKDEAYIRALADLIESIGSMDFNP